jgi:predicted Zn-dependent protease
MSDGAAFSEVLDELRRAQSLHLRVDKEGEPAEVWVRAPGLVRWEDSPQRYRIAAGSRLWEINEQANTVTTDDSPWFRSSDQQIDLLALLDLDVQDAGPLLDARPIAKTNYGGRESLVYRVSLPARNRTIEIEAFADAKTQALQAILARRAGTARDAQSPLAELHLVAMNEELDDAKFVVAKTLTEDGRIGKVTDAQGIVVIRPVLARRWTPICRELPLKPGDWLRTELRGANAVKATLSSGAEITLGPGSLLECISPTEARLHRGEAQVRIPSNDAAMELLAPRQGSRKFAAGKHLLRVDREEKLVEIPAAPLWLQGFEGTIAGESLGSLIVNLPDGRNEPLTVGYHKVSVEIRDQIARTTIEESFVNHTAFRMEGVFHFPLPADASISGFGMWIGNDLVEADIVEKQRAREIYETILRERRDPGLLEWTGGNLFKARVFPIEAHSEKRIKIVYTQVLPLRAGRYRYSYGLRSELLRTRPLRELSLTVTVNSAAPLKSIACPTHSARIQQTKHSGQVEFNAQEYAPDRDFEVVCELDGSQSDVVVIPHRRGDDGYLLVQLSPPAEDGRFEREVLTNGNPLNLVLLCDTSSSMDSQKRQEQRDFAAAVLASLDEMDRFNLVAADVGTAWAFPEPVAATAENIAKASSFLEERLSLGWTNLERAFTDVLKKSPAESHIIYIGDGIISAGETDPPGFVKLLDRLTRDNDQQRTFHAVTVGNVYESTVLQGIAEIGGGSVRRIGGEETPQAVAMELLQEITQPGLKDLAVEFRGLKVAAVYPGWLPNVPAGTQQILIGRYLPEGKDQQGEVIVTGARGGEKVRYAARVSFKDAEEGNSFIPRLWARAHLDHLLQQGTSEAIRDEIIALSEEFHIITPYTSLLVLETDEDRERFGVKRRYEMRDGERFFAEGRATANYELLQQQMKRAGDWRLGLRRQVLRYLATLGRDAHVFEQQAHLLDRLSRRSGIAYDMPAGMAGAYGPAAKPMSAAATSFNGPMGGFGGGDLLGDYGVAEQQMLWDESAPVEQAKEELADRDESYFAEDNLSLSLGDSFDLDQDGIPGAEWIDAEPALVAGGKFKRLEHRFESAGGDYFSSSGLFSLGVSEKSQRKAELFGESLAVAGRLIRDYEGYYPDYTSWLNTVFPPLAPPPGKPEPVKTPEGWSPEAIELSKSLLRVEALAKLEGGIELRRVADTFDPRWDRRSSHNRDLVLFGPTAWLSRTLDPEDHAIVEYCNAEHRGVFSLALLLGRERASTKEELKTPPLGLMDASLSPLHESYRYYQARVEPAGENRVMLILTMKDSTYELRLLIDTARHVLLKQESLDDDKVSSTTTFDNFVEIGGAWWARKVVILDSKDRKIGETTYDLSEHDDAEFAQRVSDELAAKEQVQFLQLPLPKLKTARQKTADGSAGFDDQMVLLLYNAHLQQWDEVLQHLDAAEKLAAGKPGVRWVRTVLLGMIRRNEEARQRLLEEARRLAADRQEHEVYVADLLLSQAQSVCSAGELNEFVELLAPLYDRQPAELGVKVRWQNYQLAVYEGMGGAKDALALRKSMAEAAPWDVYQQAEYARRLAAAGQLDAAAAWIKNELGRPVDREQHEDDQLRTALADLYRTYARWSELLDATSEWIAQKPESESPYQQHLAALVYNDQLDDANALAEEWLKESRIEGKLPRDQRARLDAAISFAQGNAYYLSFQYMDERWQEPLALAARFFIQHKHHSDVVQRIFAYRFSESEAGDRVRGHFLALLRSDLASLEPSQISFMVGQALSGRLELEEPIDGRKQVNAAEVPDEIWRKIADELRPRWAAAETKDDKHALGEALATIYSNRFRDTDYLPFLRQRIETAPEEYKLGYVSVLFDELLSRAWTEAIQAEAFQVLRRLSAAEQPENRLTVELPALYRLVDAMLANRQAAAQRELLDAGEVNQLTRTELLAKKAEFRKTVREGLAARVAAEASKEEGPLAPWLRMEEAWLEVALDQNLKETEEACWDILGEAPPKQNDEDEKDLTPEQFQERVFAALLRHRAFVTVMNLAVRRSAAPATIERVTKYIDEGIAHGGDQAEAWRATKFQFLIARDEPDNLERELRAWIRDDVSTAPWRMMLARLVAERGKIDEAIRLYEAAEKDRLLTAADYRVLADWYLVADRRAAYERSRIEAFKQAPEHVLSNMMHQIRNRWYRTDIPLPSELDENTLFAFRALFEKSAQPENYLWQLREVYAACRDFRLLAMLPDAVLGRSPQQIYTYLQSLNGQVLYEMRNEATADEIISRIEKLREGERTPADLRALDLLEALVERRSSEVLNQPGPHVEACLMALQRAFDREWGEGEPRLMAAFLYSLGTLPNPNLAEEQLRELRALQGLVEPGSRDHLHITSQLANTMFWSYNRRDEANQEMEVEVRAYEQKHEGAWPHEDNEVLGSFVRMLEGAKRHAAGEAVLQKHLAHPEHDQQKAWLEDRLVALYNDALENDSTVSLGSGATLFRNLVSHGLKRLETAPDENVRYNLVSRMLTTYEIAHRHKLAGVDAELRKFAFQTIPGVLKQQQGQYRNTATAPLSLVGQVLGNKAVVQYIVERMEQYPQRFEISWDNSWNAFGYELARHRHEAAQPKENLGELTPRVLAIVIRELKRDLRTGESRNPYIHHNDYSYFWEEKAADFAKAAEEVYQERMSSGRGVLTISHYLWHGLDLRSRAIEMLLLAHRDAILDEPGQKQLIDYLHLESRYAESIPLLEKFIETRPDVMRYRAQLMAAYFHTRRPEQLRQLLEQTDAHFHEGGRWTEQNIAELAGACLGTDLFEKSVAYFNEAVSLYQRRNPGAGAGDATLSNWYQQLAQAHSKLGRTKEAVDAASAAIVAWGPRDTDRHNALLALRNVLTDAKDLDQYVEHLDAEAAKSGQDSPILRKAIGQVYQSRGEHAKAIGQLKLAVELQPLDKEAQQELLAAYDAAGQRDEATRQLVKLIDADRHNLALYQQLAERMKDDESEAERAATSIIEADPQEAENHAALAELRQKQDRWDEAIPHWTRVAELRRLEPTGLLRLAEAQLHEKQWNAARESIDKLHKTEWPARFSDVQNQTRRLEEQLPK